VVLYSPYGFLLSAPQRFGGRKGTAAAVRTAAHGRAWQCVLAQLVRLVLHYEHRRERRSDTLRNRFSNIFFHKYRQIGSVFPVRFIRLCMHMHGNGLQVRCSLFPALLSSPFSHSPYPLFHSSMINSQRTAQTVGYAVVLIGFVFQSVLQSGYG
jgi:hypothetical protein